MDAVLAEIGRIEYENESLPKKPIEPVSLDHRLASLAALIPFLGSRVWSSIGVTTLLAAVCVAMLPATGDTQAAGHRRIASQLNILRTIAETYRVEHGSYPDAGTWRTYVERADPRFYDPWARPYRYEPNAQGGVTLGTLGRDGVEGGSGDDDDVSASFAPDGSENSRTWRARAK